MSIAFKKQKFVDYFVVLLVLSALVLIFRLIERDNTDVDFIPQGVPRETPTAFGRNREFPPDFTEEEKIILTEQYHDYERTTIQMDKDYERFLELLKSYRSYTPRLTLISYKDDCFGRPAILVLSEGEELTITNSGDKSVEIGINGGQAVIGPNETVNLPMKFVEFEENQTIWGYSCSQKGLAGYFIKEN